MSSVAMPPSPSTSRAFHNKPYYPNLTLRRSTRLLASDSSPVPTNNTRRQHQSAPQPSSSPKRRRTPNATHSTSTPTIATAPAPAASSSSSKRKADSLSIEDDDEETSSPIMNRRKKRKENTVTDKTSPQMRATIQNKPRPRSSTNKYGTRSAAFSLSTTDAVVSTPALEESLSEPPTTARQPSPSPPSLPPKVIDEIAIEQSPCPPPVVTHIINTGEAPSAPIAIEPLQQDVEMYIPEVPVPSPPSSSYVTYTDLTPSFPERQFDHDATMQSVPSPPQPPSLLSELHDGFTFSCDPDLDPRLAFAPPPLQDPMEAVSYGSGPISEDEWHAMDRQRQMEEYERQKRESMRAGQRQDRLWISWTSKKFNYLIEHYGGIGEVRALLKAQFQRAEARKSGTQTSNKENTTGRASSFPSTSLTIDTHPLLPIQPSFEMYSPETDESEVGEKSDMEDEEDEEDSDSSADDDMVPEPEVNPHFELPPAPVLSPLKANPCSGRLVLCGTPPFLERRKAWGGDNLLTLSMKSSTDLQQVRPQNRGYSPSLLSRDLPTLSYTAPSAHSPYIDAPASSPYPPPSPVPSYPESPGSLSASDFSSSDLAATNNSFDDPSIMHAIIASMNPAGIDFNFGGSINWADGMGSLPEVSNRGWQPPPSSSVSEESSLPRSSHTLSASSSTLHSALG